MIPLDESAVNAAAPNADAAKNGRGLVIKGKFRSFSIDPDETVIFGECEGSGSKPYQCSCDFQRPDSPTHRCTCPSRQFPCKHCVGLMYAFVLKRSAFKTSSVPDDLTEKRDKLAARAEKRLEAADKPKTVNKTALAKKIKAQLDGLDLLERLTLDLTRIGIGNMNAKTAREIEEKAKQLGNAYLSGAQSALHRYTTLFSSDEGAFDASRSPARREAVFSEALDQLSRLHTLVKQGRAYLQRRLEDPDLKPEIETGIAAWLGHAWQLAELRAAGLIEADAQLVQLAFNSHDDVARQEYIDTGIWMNLGSGRIQLTQTYRPYKAVKYIRSDDSFFMIAVVPELCIYPGDVNRRIRWEAMVPRPVKTEDLKRVHEHARFEFGSVIKEVKNNLKGPLADKQPVYALRYRRIGQIDGTFLVQDDRGDRLAMTDAGMTAEPPSCHLLALLSPRLFEGQTLIARFRHDLDTRQLRIKPLSIVTDSNVVRMTF